MILINSSPKNALRIFQPFLPIFVPVGIGSLLAVTEQKGINAKFFDEQIENNVLEKIKEEVKTLDAPYIFGFSVLTAAFRSALELSKTLKELYPDSVILFGGIHPSAMPEETLSYDHVDIVLRGEGEEILPELYEHIKNKKDYFHLNNISYRRDGKIVHNKKKPIIKELNSLPPFPYHLFADKKKYNLGFALSSRGCPYNCIFCSNRVTTKKQYRFRSAESVVEDLDTLYHKYNQRSVLFLDDNFLTSKKRIYTLIDEIKKRGLHKKMQFNFQARGDNVDEKILQDLYDAGFKSVFFGIESASNRLLDIVKKGETIEEIVNAIEISKKIGYHVSATFIYALPSETGKDRMDCVEMSKKLDLDMVRFNNATPYPGTELYDIAKKENTLHIQGLYDNFNSVSTFIENPFDKIPFSYVPKGSSEKNIRNDILFSYLSFYIDRKKLERIFIRPDLGVGWFDAGEKATTFIKNIPALALLVTLLIFKYIDLFFHVLIKKDTSISIKDFFGIFVNLFKSDGDSKAHAIENKSKETAQGMEEDSNKKEEKSAKGKAA